MKPLFEVKEVDRVFYESRLKSFLPSRMIDVHTHIWLADFMSGTRLNSRGPTWPARVARDNPADDLIASYGLLFPDQQVKALLFGHPSRCCDLSRNNHYVAQCAKEHGMPALMITVPDADVGDLERQLDNGGFIGAKVYLDLAPEQIPSEEICIYDFLPKEQLTLFNERSAVVMLHIPRPARLKDPLNLRQMMEIEQEYPHIRLIIAHVGRAYCPEDIGNAFEVLSRSERMMFDFSANTNEQVFIELIKAVGPKRILFGSDLPITRMRMKRVCENGSYINIVPKDLYGDLTGESHMREAEGEDAESLTFFMYEEVDAFRRAVEKTGLSKEDIADIFYRNAERTLGLDGEWGGNV
ncbi:MAG: amidohydrolase [Clostridia bacterium]|nr:amidohydrolase [Clostridia bacterium]